MSEHQATPQFPSSPTIGLALGGGAARGWAHAGVMRALDELGVQVDVYAGCSAGALAAGAKLLGIWDEFTTWAQQVGPVSAATSFGLQIAKGGVINPEKAFSQFRDYDQRIEDLGKTFGSVATDLATGQEVWLTKGSVLDACRASSAIPIVFQAVSHLIDDEEHWLIDGGVSNPVPVNLARALGADKIIAVDLNASAQVLARFDRPSTRALVPLPEPTAISDNKQLGKIESFIRSQSREVRQRIAMAKARFMSRPQLFETAVATIEIIQMQLAQSRAQVSPADIYLTPDLSGGSAASFENWEEFEIKGYEATIAQQDQIIALTQ